MIEIEMFLNDMQSNNCSPTTLVAYRHHLNDIFNFVGSLDKLNQESLRQYRQSRKDVKPVTLGYYLISLRSFLRWAIKNNLNVMNPELIEVPKTHDRKLTFLDSKQLSSLLSQPKSLRDYAILQVLFSTGIRVSELVALDRDFDLDSGELTILGKGGHCRLVFLSKTAVLALKNYLATRHDSEKALFLGKGRLSVRSVQSQVAKYARMAKIPFKVSPHVLRHSMATDLLRGGADLRSIQELLGHKSIATTQIYTHVTNESLQKVFRDCHSNL